MLAISYNCLPTPQQVVMGKKTALDMWQALQIQHEGKGYVIKYNAIQKYVTLKYEDFTDPVLQSVPHLRGTHPTTRRAYPRSCISLHRSYIRTTPHSRNFAY